MKAWILLLLVLPATLQAAPARRVITLAPHATELVIAAGGSKRLIAAVPAAKTLAPGILQLSTIGGIDRELMLALQPDLVIAWQSGNRPSDIAWLRRQGIPLYLSEPGSIEGVAAEILAIGRLLGTPDKAVRSARRFLAATGEPCTAPPQQDVYVEIWDHPAMTVGGRHWLNDALARAGLHNTFARVKRGIFSVEREALLARETLPRVRLRQGARLGSDRLARPGPRLADAIRDLCRQRQAGMAPR